jgi:hypothetical protein
MCATCIFRPGNLMQLKSGRVRGMIDQAKADDSAIVCHSTLDGPNAVCRGYYDRHAEDVLSLTLAERVGIIEEVPPPPKEEL